MRPTWLLKDIRSKKILSISWITKIEKPSIDFDYNRRFDLFGKDAWRIAKRVAAVFPNKTARKSIPICHATYHDGSEQDLWVHYAIHGEAVLLIEVSHSYIDHHFVNFKLWETDQGAALDYPIDRLFIEDLFKEKTSDRSKIGEMYIRPVTISIHAFKFNPSNLMSEDNKFERLSRSLERFPLYKFWKNYEDKDYVEAGNVLSIFLDQLSKNPDVVDGYVSFIRSVYAVCKYQAGDFESAAELFILSGKEYLRLELNRNADTCFFFALEAGRKIPDMNKAYQIAQKIVDCLLFLDENFKTEVFSIIKSYYSSVFIGTAVLCRRIIELSISEKLEKLFGVSIKKQIQTAKKNGEIDKGIGPGLYGILQLAKLRGIISDNEYVLASHIKDFGNNIHKKGGIKNALDAKYAIQSCLHLVHRI